MTWSESDFPKLLDEFLRIIKSDHSNSFKTGYIELALNWQNIAPIYPAIISEVAAKAEKHVSVNDLKKGCIVSVKRGDVKITGKFEGLEEGKMKLSEVTEEKRHDSYFVDADDDVLMLDRDAFYEDWSTLEPKEIE